MGRRRVESFYHRRGRPGLAQLREEMRQQPRCVPIKGAPNLAPRWCIEFLEPARSPSQFQQEFLDGNSTDNLQMLIRGKETAGKLIDDGKDAPTILSGPARVRQAHAEGGFATPGWREKRRRPISPQQRKDVVVY